MGSIETAFRTIDRADFLPEEVRDDAALDIPLSIGYGQTNSQPSVVAMMLDWLEPQPGDKVLDVGSGSGWTTALLAHIVGAKGAVYAVEKIPELVAFGRNNCAQAGIRNARFFEAGKSFGLQEYAPYDRILVSAGADRLPQELINQLKTGGKLVVPVGSSVLEISKGRDGQLETLEHAGFLFVPLR